jgi:antitoxin (DNA-binding transcriptional repressor) of toxin-antitoxin stability system
MKKVSLKDLKKDLSTWAEIAAKGDTVLVSRYNKPYVYLSGNFTPALHWGGRVGKEDLSSPFKEKAISAGKWQTVLDEDRSE